MRNVGVRISHEKNGDRDGTEEILNRSDAYRALLSGW